MPDGLQLEDTLWRLRNIYQCHREGVGDAITFRPREEQLAVFKHLIERPTVPLYIIKSRRLGISTAIGTFQADGAVFSSGWRGLLIDQNEDEAKKKMVEIIRFAADSLPREILAKITFDKRNDSELRLRQVGESESEASVIYAAISGRGGDCTMLHVSEWGPIANMDPKRSNEIRTGTFPAARLARRVVETTWYGGKGGDLWELVEPILSKDPNSEGVIMFFPWHNDPAAIRLEGMVTPEIEQYFKELAAKLGRTFDENQKKWYASKRLEQGIFVKREYPSTLEEALSAPMRGSIYGDIITALRVGGKVYPFTYDKSYPVYTSWDIGWDDTTAVWFWQLRGNRMDWVHYLEGRHITAGDAANLVRQTGIPVSGHYLPHDAAAKDAATGASYDGELTKAGLLNIKIVRRVPMIWIGINQTRDLLDRSTFNEPGCRDGLTALEAYHTPENKTTGVIDPVHDWSSHGSSAARTAAEAINQGMVSDSSAIAQQAVVRQRQFGGMKALSGMKL
jgi:hypothetical protein